MEVTQERDGGGMSTIKVVVPAERVDEVYQQAVKDLKRHVNVPGFRRGRVPPRLVESILGPETILKYATERFEEHIVPDAMKALPTLVALDEADVQLGELVRGEPCQVTVKVLTAVVDPGEYKGVAVEQYRVQVTDDEVEHSLEHAYDNEAEYLPTEHTDVRDGDWVTFTLRIVRDGYLVEDYDDDDPLRVRIGHNSLNPSLDDQLVGLSVDQPASFQITYPADYENEELAGATAEFNVKIVAIETRPSLDEWVTGADRFESREAAVESFRERLTDQRAAYFRIMAREAAVQAAMDQARIDLPRAQIEAAVMEEIEEFEEDLEARGVDLDGLEDGEIEAEHERIRARVEQDLKRDVYLRALAQIEQIELTREDFVRELSMLSTYNRVEPRLLMKRLEESGQMAAVARNAMVRRAAEMIIEHAAVTEVDPPAELLHDHDHEHEPEGELVAEAVDEDVTAPERAEDEPCP